MYINKISLIYYYFNIVILMKKDFLKSMCDVMNENMFSEFFENYFNDWDDIIATIMLMKAYQAMCKKFENLDYDERLHYIRNLMKNSDFRHKLANNMIHFMENNSNIKHTLSLPNLED